MDRLERLLNLTAALISADRPLRRDDLRVRVYEGIPDDEAFRRNFERDKQLLREMGVPIVVIQLDPGDPEAGEGYQVDRDDYALPDPGLEPEELAALHLAATAVRLEGGEATAAIWKLGGGGPAPGDAAAPVVIPGSDHLPVLWQAVTTRTAVRFAYRGEERLVEPWQLSFQGGHWYLTGLDRLRAGERQFRLDRMTSPPQTAGSAAAFERPATIRGGVKPWEMGDADPVEVRVWIDAEQARYAAAYAGEEAIAERRDDGSVVLALQVRHREALRSFVLGLLDHAEVLGPPAIRADLIAWLQALAA